MTDIEKIQYLGDMIQIALKVCGVGVLLIVGINIWYARSGK